jgi:hypothetical protein
MPVIGMKRGVHGDSAGAQAHIAAPFHRSHCTPRISYRGAELSISASLTAC